MFLVIGLLLIGKMFREGFALRHYLKGHVLGLVLVYLEARSTIKSASFEDVRAVEEEKSLGVAGRVVRGLKPSHVGSQRALAY